MAPGHLALVGSGESLPVMAAVERALLAGRPPVYVQIPTAAAPEGPASLERWTALGAAQARRLGVQARPLMARDRAEADDPVLAAQVAGAGLVYLSGGSPPFLAATLSGTALWDAVLQAWRGGASLAGCSAGAIALTGWVPDIRRPTRPAGPGLGLLPHLRVIPHFDALLGRFPGVVDRFLLRAPDGTSVLGIDEETALVWDGDAWHVRGRQAVWRLEGGRRTPHRDGDRLDLPPPAG